jgi:hypothetical protein
MRAFLVVRWAVLLGSAAGFLPCLTAQGIEDTLDIYTEHPRLFLRPQRLKLLQRERDRRTTRWIQFETLMAGKAPMPETGFAQALYYQISGDAEAGRQAVRWALGTAASDLRQLALVFDWCQAALTEAQSKALAAKMVKSIAASEKDKRLPAIRDRALAAVALAGHQPEVSARQIEWLVNSWWRKEMVPAVKGGRDLAPRESIYALFEILHAVRDNMNVDLRDPVPGYFKGLPIFQLVSYYPATFAAPEGEYRIPSGKGIREPDLKLAAMSRVAELCMVAYDSNAPESQILQGWLMHDNFILRGTLGVTYELLWANPYQPGLSYYLVPLQFHDDMFGRLFIRSSWEENAKWLGYFDGELQYFEDGKPAIMNPQLSLAPIVLPEGVVMSANYAKKFKIQVEEGATVFIVALKPRQAYEIEVDDEEMREEFTDPGGILSLKLPPKISVGVRMREAKRQAQ